VRNTFSLQSWNGTQGFPARRRLLLIAMLRQRMEQNRDASRLPLAGVGWNGWPHSSQGASGWRIFFANHHLLTAAAWSRRWIAL
jgi:hypothetical protein